MKGNKYGCIFRMGLEEAMEYRFDFVMTLLSMIFPVITSICLWTAVNQNTDSIASTGYTYPQLLLYTILAALMSKLITTGFENQINEDIKMGGLNKYIVKPVSYLRYRYCAFMGNTCPSMILFLTLTAATMIYFSFYYGIYSDGLRVFLFLVTLLLAVSLRFLLFLCVAMWSFWFADASGMFGTINVVIWVISGGIFPVTIFGTVIENVSKILPFQYLTQFSVDTISGRLALGEIKQGLGVQCIWMFVLGILAVYLWNRGLKNYVAVGG
ncbi:MAG: ABC transporter permease [Hungatella sp.]|nr:ABC transporter permease [Hungatella sp.]